MAITFRAAGTAKKVASGNFANVGLPTGHAANDLLIAPVITNDNVTVAVGTSGYTKLGTWQNGTGLQLVIMYKIDGGAETAPSFTHSAGGVGLAQILAFSGVNTTTPIQTTGTSHTDTGSGGSGTITANGITPTYTNSHIFFIACEEVDATDGAGSNYYSGWSGTNPTLTERADSVNNTSGTHEVSYGLAHGLSDGSATGSRTVTLANLSTGTWIGLSILLEIADASPTGGGSSLAFNQDKIRVTRYPIVRASTY